MSNTSTPVSAKRTIDVADPYRMIALVCSLVAAAVHALVTPEHFGESPLIGSFFAVVAAGQLALAWRLRHRVTEGVMQIGIWTTATLVALYVASRTFALPFMPPHLNSRLPVEGGIGNGTPIFPGSRMESVGVPDMLALLAELGLIFGLLLLLPSQARSRATTILAWGSIAGVVVYTTGLFV